MLGALSEAVRAAPLFRQEGWSPPVSINYLHLGLGFLLVEQAFEVYLGLRQRRHLAKTDLPRDLADQVRAIDDSAAAQSAPKAPGVQVMERRETDGGAEGSATLLGQLHAKFAKSQAYNLDKNSASFFNISYSTVANLTMVLTGASVWIWVKAEEATASWFGLDPAANEIVVGSLFLVAQSLLNVVINLPTSLYSTFVVEGKHGFNKMTPALYFSDVVKGLAVENVLFIPLMAGIVKVVRWGGEGFWLYVWMLTCGFSLAMLTIYPNFIMPLFNKYEPLPAGELKEAIEALAASLEFPLTKLYMVDGSTRSSHSNAYLFGFHKDKRIVLYDTLITNADDPALECSTEEIVGILAHECGHWKLSHTLKGFLLQNFVFLLVFRGFAFFLHDPDMYASFGFVDHPVIIGLNLFMDIMSPVGAVLGLFANSLTRRFEYEADAYAVSLGKVDELKSGLCKISLSNLSSFHIDPLYAAFYHSHPTLTQRLSSMDYEASKLRKKVD